MSITHTDCGQKRPLTRRTFLEQFGLAGGTTLVMAAMQSWDLMAQAGPRPMLSGRPNGTRVVVLGAGVSGLVIPRGAASGWSAMTGVPGSAAGWAGTAADRGIRSCSNVNVAVKAGSEAKRVCSA
jgi:hypothetical protein